MEHALTYIMWSFDSDLFISNKTLAFLEQCVLLSCSFAWALFLFLLAPSPVIFHPTFTFTGPTCVCTPSAGPGDSGNCPSTLLLPGQYSCELLVSAALEIKEGWKDALGVWDQHEAAACFSFDLDTVQVLFHFHLFFFIFSFFRCLYLCTLGNVWDSLPFYIYMSPSVSGLTFIGSPSTACSSRSSSPSSGRNHVRVPPLTLLICPSTFQPLFFLFPYSHFCTASFSAYISWLQSWNDWLGRLFFFLSFSLHPFILSFFISS